MTTLPPLPIAPPAGATAAERQAFEDAMAVYRAAASALHAQAQADTAAAMAAMRPVPQSETDLKRMMLLDIACRAPHHNALTESSAMASAKKTVDAIFAAYPVGPA